MTAQEGKVKKIGQYQVERGRHVLERNLRESLDFALLIFYQIKHLIQLAKVFFSKPDM